MQKVITINLNGRAYQLDEDAYATLNAYLTQARLALKDNPDLAEILLDLEQAIADKCQRFLGPHKSVVQKPEVVQILDEMGPVDTVAGGPAAEPAPGAGAGPAAGASAQAPRDATTPKRLYLLEDDAWIGGVCSGIAAYFKIDAAIVRVIFVVVALTTKGVATIVYAILWFTLPEASTAEEEAAAHGVPFNAKEIVEQAKAKAQVFAEKAVKQSATFSSEWKQHSREWRRESRRWRREARAERRRARRNRRMWGSWASGPQMSATAPPIGYAGQILAGILVPVLTLVSAAFFWLWVSTMMSLFVTGAIFGHELPSDLPLWAAFLLVLMAFTMISVPVQQARHASHAALGGRYYYGGVAAWDSMMWIGFWLLCGWAAWEYIPEVRQFVNELPSAGPRFREIFRFR